MRTIDFFPKTSPEPHFLQRVINNYSIHSKPNTLTGNYILNFCHPLQQNDYYIQSSTNSILFKFTTDKDTEELGFELYYTFVSPENVPDDQRNFTDTYKAIVPVDPRSTGNSNEINSGKSLAYMMITIPLLFFILITCQNIHKHVERFEANGGSDGNNVWYNSDGVLQLSNENIPDNVHRAQNALVVGLLQRRPSVIELSRRLIQEEQLLHGRIRAARDQPPSYETIGYGLGNVQTLNQRPGSAVSAHALLGSEEIPRDSLEMSNSPVPSNRPNSSRSMARLLSIPEITEPSSSSSSLNTTSSIPSFSLATRFKNAFNLRQNQSSHSISPIVASRSGGDNPNLNIRRASAGDALQPNGQLSDFRNGHERNLSGGSGSSTSTIVPRERNVSASFSDNSIVTNLPGYESTVNLVEACGYSGSPREVE